MSVMGIILSLQRGKLFLCACPVVRVCPNAAPMYVKLPLFTQQVAIIDFGLCFGQWWWWKGNSCVSNSSCPQAIAAGNVYLTDNQQLFIHDCK